VTTRPLQEEPEVDIGPDRKLGHPTQKQLMEACEDRGLGNLTREWVAAALARGDVCAAVFEGDRIVAYTWVSFCRAPHVDGIWVEFRKPYRYGYKAFVRPDCRGQRLSPSLALFSDALCIERGFSRTVAFVETHNYASIKSSWRQEGREFVGFAGYLKLFGRVFPFRTKGARQVTFRFVSPREVES
jgi:hypothetical protein